jgi:hypothetical protein
MPKSSQRLVTIACFLAVLLVAGLLAGLIARRSSSRPFFSLAPRVLTLHDLGSATNYLKLVDRDHAWRAFSVSNGTSKALFYTVTEIEYRTADGWRSAGSWLSNTLANTSLKTRRETAGEIPPGTTDVFYATIATSNLPWRLRVGCFESSWQDSSVVRGLGPAIRGLPPPTSKSWSGSRYELISEEISP